MEAAQARAERDEAKGRMVALHAELDDLRSEMAISRQKVAAAMEGMQAQAGRRQAWDAERKELLAKLAATKGGGGGRLGLGLGLGLGFGLGLGLALTLTLTLSLSLTLTQTPTLTLTLTVAACGTRRPSPPRASAAWRTTCCAASSPPLSPPRATRRTASRAPPPMCTLAPPPTGPSDARCEGRGVGERRGQQVCLALGFY